MHKLVVSKTRIARYNMPNRFPLRCHAWQISTLPSLIVFIIIILFRKSVCAVQTCRARARCGVTRAAAATSRAAGACPTARPAPPLSPCSASPASARYTSNLHHQIFIIPTVYISPLQVLSLSKEKKFWHTIYIPRCQVHLQFTFISSVKSSTCQQFLIVLSWLNASLYGESFDVLYRASQMRFFQVFLLFVEKLFCAVFSLS